MGNVITNCFTQKKEEEEKSKYYEPKSSGTAVDRISDLPDDILHIIVSFLPFKSLGKTSVLSRRWNDLWSSYIMSTVLAPHEDTPCLKLSLPRVGWDLNRSCLSRVEELVLHSRLRNTGNECRPQCWCGYWGNSKAWLGFPTSYVVRSYLHSLHSLTLIRVDFSDSSALDVDLFSGSSFPYLEKLKLQSCRGRSDLKICCPNLKYIRVSGMDLNSLHISGTRLEELGITSCFKECTNGSCVNIFAPKLLAFFWSNSYISECSIQSFPVLKRSYMYDDLPSSSITTNKINYRSFVDLLSASSQVEALRISDNYLQILSGIYFESGGLPFSFMKLHTLTVLFPIKKLYIPGMACLLKSSPVVHSLYILFYGYNKNDGNSCNNQSLDDANCTQEQYWESQSQILSPFLSHLEEVNISLDKMIPESGIIFAKFVLKYGRHLQQMRVTFRKSIRSRSSLPPKSLRKTIALIERFPRASADIKISTICL